MNIARDVQRAPPAGARCRTCRGTSSTRPTRRPRASSAATTTTSSRLSTGRSVSASRGRRRQGVPASLVMSRISSVVRSTVEFVQDAAEAVFKINNHICAKAVEGRFVTFV